MFVVDRSENHLFCRAPSLPYGHALAPEARLGQPDETGHLETNEVHG